MTFMVFIFVEFL